MIPETLFILYVSDQRRSADFYGSVLASAPRLDVPGMTEFVLPGGGVLGIMPESGIRRLLGTAVPDPSLAQGIPRAELYLLLDSIDAFLARAIAAGAVLLSPAQARDWGHTVVYLADPDGHVLAFASAA